MKKLMVTKMLAAVAACGLWNVSATTLEQDFLKPPQKAGVHAWWHWVGYNVSSNGITRDLEAMKAAGVGGATVFTIASHAGKWNSLPMENQLCTGMSYMNDVWWAHLKFAAEEAKRLGLEVGMHNCPGFSVSGGTWIDPEHAMKKLVWTKCRAPERPPEPNHGPLNWYREIGETTYDGWNYRFGYHALASRPRPSPDDIAEQALECDKLSAEAVKIHLDHVLIPLKERLGSLVGTSFGHILMDSYEAGACNWTQTFRDEFVASCGYDPLPHLPALAGAQMPDAGRFQEDMQKVVAELFTKNHYRPFHDRLAALGIQFQLEPYGGPFNGWEAARYADIPMVEFWALGASWYKPGQFGGYPGLTGATGRAFGRRVIATEAFTGGPQQSRWSTSPRDLKDCGDATFARGINRLTLHHWAHQPFDPQWLPGNTMGFWGTHFGECNAWFEMGKSWYGYLNRCQALLQRGEQTVDMLAVKDSPQASEFDAIPESAFLTDLTVLPNGDVKLPSGRTYRLVRLPTWGKGIVPVEVARRVRGLVKAGAAVWATNRFTRVYGLAGGKAADAEVQAIAEELWTKPSKRFFTTGTPEEALAALGVKPAFEALGEEGDPLRPVLGSARTEGDVSFFFVCNTSTNTVRKTLAFRGVGRVPEFWDAERATMRKVDFWTEREGRSFIDYTFKPLESMFVVFRTAGQPVAKPKPEEKFVCAVIADPGWTVSFEPGRGAPRSPIALETLTPLSEIDIPGVKYFAGTAIYRADLPLNFWKALPCTDGTSRKNFITSGKRFLLNLGDVGVMAEVTVNGKPCGTTWHAPFVVDVTGAIKEGDHNEIEIRVATTWRNRMIGDAHEEDDCTWWTMKGKSGRGLRRLPDFVLGKGERPSKNRVCFCVWDYFGVNTPLQPSGLIGPVTIESYR